MNFERLESLKDVFNTIEEGDEIIVQTNKSKLNRTINHVENSEIHLKSFNRVLKLSNETVVFVEITEEGYENVKDYLNPKTLVNYDKQVWAGENQSLISDL